MQWTEFIFEILLTHNKLIHSSHGMTPSDARKNSNEMDVKLQLLSHRKHNRKYRLLEIGDKVKFIESKSWGKKNALARGQKNHTNLKAYQDHMTI